MKLIQLNIWQGRIIRKAVSFLSTQDTDIICLNEVYSSEEDLKLGWDAFQSLELVQQSLNYPHKYFAPLYSYSIAGHKVTFGNTILSRYELTERQDTFINGHYVDDAAVEELVPNTRNIQKAVVKIPEGDFTLVNHHAYWEATPEGSDMSVECMHKVVDFIGDVDGPLIITGDMNVNPDTPTAKLLDNYGHNLIIENNIDNTMSLLAKFAPVAPDHIIVSDEIKVKNFQVSDEIISDHLALILEFNL